MQILHRESRCSLTSGEGAGLANSGCVYLLQGLGSQLDTLRLMRYTGALNLRQSLGAIAAFGLLAAGSPAWAAGTPQPRPAAAAPSATQRAKVSYDAYILGPGDSLQVELLDIPELSGTFSIGPDGTMYLPRLRALYVEGLTVEELRYFLTVQFKTYVKNPQVFLTPFGYRAVRVYVGGEISRPGYFMLSGGQVIQDHLNIQDSSNPNSFRAQNSSL